MKYIDIFGVFADQSILHKIGKSLKKVLKNENKEELFTSVSSMFINSKILLWFTFKDIG